jgi:hypothetical protein
MKLLFAPNARIYGVLLTLTACLTLAIVGSTHQFMSVPGEVTASAARGKPSPAPTPSNNTTSTIYDKSVDDSTFLQLRSDDLNPDLTGSSGAFGTYGTSTSNSVLDRFEGYNNSDWSVHLENSSTRWIGLTLSRLTGSGPTGDYNLHGRVISRCFDPTGATTDTVGWSSVTTSNPNCSMHINFTIAGTQYALVMTPYQENTGRALVSCNVVSGGQCVDWTIVPNLTQDNVVNPSPTVADLFSIAPHNGKQTLVGTYYLTYRVHLTRP